MERSGAVRIMPPTVMTIRPIQSVSAVLTRGSRGFLGCSPSIVPGGGVGLIPVRTRAAALAGPFDRRLGQLGHAHDTVGLRHVDQPHPLRVAADLAHVVHPGAEDLALGRHDHDLVSVADLMERDRGPVLLGHLDADDAFAGPALESILAHERALAVAALRDREDGRGGVGGDRLHADHVVPLIQGDAAHAVGGAAHRPDVLFLEADDDPVAGAEQNLTLAVRDLHADRSEEHTSELQSLAYLVCRLISSEEHTSELQSLAYLVCRLLLEKKNNDVHHYQIYLEFPSLNHENLVCLDLYPSDDLSDDTADD